MLALNSRLCRKLAYLIPLNRTSCLTHCYGMTQMRQHIAHNRSERTVSTKVLRWDRRNKCLIIALGEAFLSSRPEIFFQLVAGEGRGANEAAACINLIIQGEKEESLRCRL